MCVSFAEEQTELKKCLKQAENWRNWLENKPGRAPPEKMPTACWCLWVIESSQSLTADLQPNLIEVYVNLFVSVLWNWGTTHSFNSRLNHPRIKAKNQRCLIDYPIHWSPNNDTKCSAVLILCDSAVKTMNKTVVWFVTLGKIRMRFCSPTVIKFEKSEDLFAQCCKDLRQESSLCTHAFSYVQL